MFPGLKMSSSVVSCRTENACGVDAVDADGVTANKDHSTELIPLCYKTH